MVAATRPGRLASVAAGTRNHCQAPSSGASGERTLTIHAWFRVPAIASPNGRRFSVSDPTP